MNLLTSRPCSYMQDQERLVDLLLDFRIAGNSLMAYPTAWRLRLLLSSRVWQPELDTRVWEGEDGRILGFAMLWARRQSSDYRSLDRLVHPDVAGSDLAEQTLTWGVRRAQQIVQEQGAALSLYTNEFPRNMFPRHQLESYGFAPVPLDPEQCNVYFERPAAPLPDFVSPAGYTLRPLQSPDELDAYAAMQGFASVSPEHMRELFASDEYYSLAAVDEAGKFAGYCEYSFCRAEWQRSGRRIGWIDYIETHTDHQRRGLGRALLLSGLQHLYSLGAETAALVTISPNLPAIRLYEASGFTRYAAPEAASFQMTVSGQGG